MSQLFFCIMVKVLKFQTLFSCSQIKCCFSELEFTKCMSEQQTEKTLIRLLLQRQSDLSMHCLSLPFMHQTGVQNFRIFTEALINPQCVVY